MLISRYLLSIFVSHDIDLFRKGFMTALWMDGHVYLSIDLAVFGGRNLWPEFAIIIEDESEYNTDMCEENLANSLITRNKTDDTLNSLLDNFQGDDDRNCWAFFQEWPRIDVNDQQCALGMHQDRCYRPAMCLRGAWGSMLATSYMPQGCIVINFLATKYVSQGCVKISVGAGNEKSEGDNLCGSRLVLLSRQGHP
ncbi:hypothetical protein VNO78_05649 [Psophocarpus tetragonolobus]|uniref:Uncharacterized protein n=1 Tax=Psophocarpus tetragonolobus TaxID=3891 RepID=A0AAN9XR20_PSOTE